MRRAVRTFMVVAVLGLGVAHPSRACAQTDLTPAQIQEWRRSAENGNRAAQCVLGALYANGQTGIVKDEAEAVKWYRKSAEQGFAAAQRDLGVMYQQGRGVARDDAVAARWYRMAAEQGYANAQCDLATMYVNGQGVAKDDDEAIKWYRRAAQQGNAAAQYGLGFMYATGRGVGKDQQQAIEWFRKAAENGNEQARAELAKFSAPSATPAVNPAERVFAKATSLKVGDAAPALSIAKWIKGVPVTAFEKDKVYVVEFWASWCGPSIQSMPHLTALQKEFKDKVTIIGVTSADTNGNTLEKAWKMVADKGDTMGYTVAWDNEQATTTTAFMEAAGQKGTPCAFVIDKAGRVAYIGHPYYLDMVLGKVVDGKWDIKAGNAEVAHKLGMSLVEQAVEDKNAMKLNEIAWGIVDPEANVKDMDLDLAMKAADEAVRISPKDAAILDTLARVCWVKRDKAKAIEVQIKAVEAAPENLKEELQATLKEYRSGK
jgi:TPR repeat protein